MQHNAEGLSLIHIQWRAGCNTQRTSVSPRQKKSAVEGKVLRVSPSLQLSPQTVQDPSSVTTAADNLPQELASLVTRGFTGSSGRPELIRRSDGRFHHHVSVLRRLPVAILSQINIQSYLLIIKTRLITIQESSHLDHRCLLLIEHASSSLALSTTQNNLCTC